jgi:membrane protease YdiL (CAAX protease family)
VPAAVLAGVSQPWSWVAGLLYAPASALGQELYFRGALLALLGRLSPARPGRTVALQALAFAVWHVRAFRVVAPGPALLVVGGTLIAGVVWGWQTHHDGTLLYALAEHTAFLVVV